MQEDYILRQEELIDNPDPRIPICLVLDVSGSMIGKPLKELQKGVEQFFTAIMNDEIAKTSAEIAIITFGGSVEVALDFRSIENQKVPQLNAGGLTPMGQAVETALKTLEKRKEEYKNAGVDYYQPWLVLMTDGFPTDSIENASLKINQLVEKRKLTVFPVAIGNKADLNTLAKLGGGKKPLRLQGLKFDKFFEWLSKSVSNVSRSTPGEKVKLPGGLEDWAVV